MIVLLLLHSYVGGVFTKVGLRLLISAHQLVLVLLSVWAVAISRNDYMSIWFWFRGVVLCFCLAMDFRPIVVQVGQILIKLEEDIYSDIMLRVHEIVYAARAQGLVR